MSNYWISQSAEGAWTVKKEGGQHASSLHKTQQEAFEWARERAIQEGGEVFIKNREGLIRERNTYGKNDPYPPRG